MDIWSISSIQKQKKTILSNVFQKCFSSFREVASSEKPKLELFLEEPESCQTGPKSSTQVRLRVAGKNI
jgi:hypothetical protein